LQNGIIPVYVFDGESHELKHRVQQERRESRKLAEEEYEKALEKGDMARARSFAQRMNRLTSDMIDDAKFLLRTMGIPVVQAPGEGEAQAAQLSREGKVWATASQDYDALMFGSPRLVRNLNISGTRSKPGGGTITISPELISLNDVLEGLQINHTQLIDMGILLGSDFNPDGVYGVGPKTAYKYIQNYSSFTEIVANEDKVKEAEIDYETIRDIFLKPNVHQNLEIEDAGEFDPDAILDFLVGERGFTEDRYKNLIMKTKRTIDELKEQTDLSDWF
jgi:flap endonuclease-1